MSVSEIRSEGGLAPNEFEIDLGALGAVRGRVTPETVRESERRIGMGFMGFAQLVVLRTVSYGALCTVLEVMVRDFMGAATPTRDELAVAVLEVGMANVVEAMKRPVSIVLTGSPE